MLSLTDSHVIEARDHVPLEMFCPYSLPSKTSIGITNRTLFLVFLWYSTKPYASVALTRTSSVPEPRLYCSRTRKLRCLPQGGVDLYWALAANVLRGIGRLCTKGSSRTRKNCVRTECLDCESSRKEQSPALVYAIEGTRA